MKERKKMKISKSRTMASLIALFLTLTIAATLVALPIAYAHDPPWSIPTWCFVNVRNQIIGVGQEQLIVFLASRLSTDSRWSTW
jgi:hypothetical protein